MQKLGLIFVILSLVFAPAALAQKAKLTRERVVSEGLRRQVKTILLGGLAGGAVGLSTLSFYGRPQTKLTHIPIGVAVGLVLGTVVSTYQLVNNPHEFLDGRQMSEPPQPASFSLSWTVSF